MQNAIILQQWDKTGNLMRGAARMLRLMRGYRGGALARAAKTLYLPEAFGKADAMSLIYEAGFQYDISMKSLFFYVGAGNNAFPNCPDIIGDSLAQLPEVPDQFFPRDVFGGGPNHFSTEQRAAQKRAWLLGKLPTVESTYLGEGRWRIVLPLTLLFEPAYLSWGSDGDV